MSEVSAGRVGRSHGRDGSFYVENPAATFEVGCRFRVRGVEREVVQRAGTDDRPIIRLAGVDDPGELRGEVLLTDEELADDEFVVADLVGCEVEGLGRVERVIGGPSCEVLEVGPDAVLVPLVRDAVKEVDLEARRIVIDRDFLGL